MISDGSGTRNFGFLGTWNHQKKGFQASLPFFDQSFKFASNLLKIQNSKLWIPDPSLQRSRKKKVGQSIEHFLRFSWLSMQFQIAKVFPASLHSSQFEKKLLGFFFLFARRETQLFPLIAL